MTKKNPQKKNPDRQAKNGRLRGRSPGSSREVSRGPGTGPPQAGAKRRREGGRRGREGGEGARSERARSGPGTLRSCSAAGCIRERLTRCGRAGGRVHRRERAVVRRSACSKARARGRSRQLVRTRAHCARACHAHPHGMRRHARACSQRGHMRRSYACTRSVCVSAHARTVRWRSHACAARIAQTFA